jgi:tetratricopeptide (TPR) repeat protein
MGGIGKTTLAVHWAQRVADKFPDGQLYADLRGFNPGGQVADAAQLMRGFLQALGVAPEQIPAAADEMTALYRSVLAGKRVLIVADNARNSAQVRPLLPSGPGSVIVVTSRSQLTGLVAADGARIWNLDVLSETESATFLAARLGPGRVNAEACAVAELGRLCGGLPLALAIVAARADLSGWPLAIFAKQLVSAEDRLEALRLDDSAADLRAVFSWSCEQLSSDSRRLFWLLAVHPGPDISVPAAASLARVSATRAAAMLRELVSACLAAERLPGRYSMHDLVRAYAAQQAATLPGTDADRRAAVHAMFQHYLHSAVHAAHLFEPPQPTSPEPPATGVIPEQATGGDEALAWFDAEREVLLAVFEQAAQVGSHAIALQLSYALEAFFRRRSSWQDLCATQEIALGSAEKLGDLRGQTRAHLHLAHALGQLRRADATRAHLATALTLSRELRDLSLEGWTYLTVCQLHPDFCDAEELIACALKTLPLAEAAGDTNLMAHACAVLGYGYALTGDTDNALFHCRRALDLWKKAADTTDPTLEGYIYNGLGSAHQRMGDHRQAVASYRRAVRIFQEHGAWAVSAESLRRLGDCQAAAGDADAAIEAWQQALTIFEDLGLPDASELRRELAEPGDASRKKTPGTRLVPVGPEADPS